MTANKNLPDPRQRKTHLLNQILFGLLVVGTVALLYFGVRVAAGDTVFVFTFYLVAYILLWTGALVQRLGYSIRAGALLLAVYVVGIGDLLFAGFWGNGVIFLLALTVLAYALFGFRFGIGAIVISLITIAVVAGLAVYGPYRFPVEALYRQPNVFLGIGLGVVFVLVSTIIVGAIRYLTGSLEIELLTTQANYNFVSDVLDIVSAMVVVLDTAGRVERINKTCVQLTGLENTDIIGQEFWEVFIPPAGRVEFKELLHNPDGSQRHFQGPLYTSASQTEKTVSWTLTLIQTPTDAQGDSNGEAADQPGWLDRFSPSHLKTLISPRVHDFVVAVGIDVTPQNKAAFEREQLLLAERKQRQFADALREAGLALTSTLNLDTMMDRLLDHVGKFAPYDAANIMLIENGQARVARVKGYDKFDANLPNTILDLTLDVAQTGNVRQMINTRRPLIIPDLQNYPDWILTQTTRFFRSWVGAPIFTQENVIACFALDKIEPNFYTAEHAERLEIFASQAALAMENVRLFEAQACRRREAETLYNTVTALSSALDLPAVLDNILTQLKQVLPYDSACVFLLESDNVRSVAASGFEHPGQVVGRVFPADDGLTRQLVSTRRPVYLYDAQTEPEFRDHAKTNKVRGWLSLPLLDRDTVIGFLTMDSHQPGFYGPKDFSLAKAFATQASVALVNAQLFKQMEEERQLSDTMRAFGASLVEAKTFTDVLDRILNYLGKVVPFDSASVMLKQDGKLKIQAAHGLPANSPARDVEFSFVDTGLTYEIFNQNMPIMMTDVHEDPRWTRIEGDDYIRSWIGVPLIVDDDVIGMLTLDHRQVGFYSERHLTIATAFAQQAAIALENARLFDAANQRVAELEAVRQATLALTSKLELETVLDNMLQTVFKFVAKAKNVHVFLFENGEIISWASILEDGTRNEVFSTPRRNGLTYTVARQGRTIIVPDMSNHPLYADAPADWVGSIVGIPLKIGDQVVGVMSVSSFESRSWPAPEIRTLELLADQAAIAIENSRLYKQVQQYAEELEHRVVRRTSELQTLYQLTQALSQANQPDGALALALTHLQHTIPHDVTAGLLVDGSTGILLILTQAHLAPDVNLQIEQLLRSQIHLPNKLEVRYLETPQAQTSLTQINAQILVPIIVGNQTVGTILVASQHDNAFSPDHHRLLRTIADQTAETIGRLQLSLAAEHQRLESLIANLPNGIILCNSARRVVLTNNAAKLLLPGLRVGDKLPKIGTYSLEKLLSSAVDTPINFIEVESDNNQFFVVDFNPVTTGPEAGGWTLIIRDVTEERLLQRRSQQQARLAAVGQLAAGIAHDFNNILTSIIGYAELMLLDRRLPPEMQEDAERITRQGQRAANLVRQILDFSRQTISEKQPVDLTPFVKETTKLLERTLPENIHIDFSYLPGNYTVVADITQLQQVLTNLALNARDAMPSGGKLTFQLGFDEFYADNPPPYADMPLGKWVALKVIDTGAGIPENDLEKIFEPFFTTKEVGRGTGLGLAQVYGIIEQHNGFIEVKSRENVGTTFVIYLVPHTRSQSIPALATQSELTQGQGELILFVEDNPNVLEIGTSIIQHFGYRVITATNGLEALEIYKQRQHEVALIITDVTMPKMGGAALTMAVRAINPDVKVIAVTGYPLQHQAKNLISDGIVDWLQKPLQINVLAGAIARALQK